MGYLEDLHNILRNVSSMKNVIDSNKDKSITRGALDGTLQFPCLVSDAIPIDMASTIARTLERVYASFVQTYLSTNNTIDISVDKNPNMFLKRFHKNIKVESTTEDLYHEYCTEGDPEYESLMERIYDGTTKAYINESENKMIVFNFSGDFNRGVFESHKASLEEALAGIDYKPFPNIGNSPFYEAIGTVGNASPNGTDVNARIVADGLNADYDRRVRNQYRATKQMDIDADTAAYNRKRADDLYDANRDHDWSIERDRLNRRAQVGMKAADMAYNTGMTMLRDKMNRDAADLKYNRDKEASDLKYQRDIELQKMRSQSELERDKFKMRYGGDLTAPSLLKDNDVKKSNDLQPYAMQVRLMAINDKNEFVQFMDFIVGVKVVLHNIKSDEMILNLQNALSNNGVLFNFIRWTTGEKSLFKDLMLNINSTKLDIANKSKGSSPWWSTLKRLKEVSRAQLPLKFFKKTKLVPQSTIVISAFDADSIEKVYGFNLRNPQFAIKLMKSLFLMNFIIVDEGTGTLDILYDGEKAYQTYALETLQREVAMNSNKLGKELTRMISR